MEDSKDKTKRKIISLLSENEWNYQYSIFCNLRDVSDLDVKDLALSWVEGFEDKKYRDYLRKTNFEQPILFFYRKNILKERKCSQIFITLFSNDPVNMGDIQSYSDCILNVLDRKVTRLKLDRSCNSIKTQRLHDLSCLGDKKRYSVINKKYLIPRHEIPSDYERMEVDF